MEALRLAGVTGGAGVFLIAGIVGGSGFWVLPPLPSSSDDGIAEDLLSSSGSFNSDKRSAALCACSAQARSASSTGAPSFGFPELVSESALDAVLGVDTADRGESEG